MTTPVELESEQLGTAEEELLAGVRRVMGPKSSDERRIRHALFASLAAGAVGPALPLEIQRPVPAPSSGVVAQGLRGLGKQLVAAGLIGAAGFGAGFIAGRVDSSPRIGAKPTVTAAAVASGQPSKSEVALPAAPLPVEAQTVEPQKVEPQKAAEASTSRNGRANVSEPASTASSTNVRLLNEEAEALRRVGHALRLGQLQLAQQLLDELDTRIPHGALGEERAAARLMLRCQNSENGAPAAAQLWLKRHSRSMYAPRVSGSCNLTDEVIGEVEK